MKEAGIVAVSDDGAPVRTADMMRKGWSMRDFDLVVINHCEDPSLADGYMNEGYNSTQMGVGCSFGSGRHYGGQGFDSCGIFGFTNSLGTHQYPRWLT